MGITHAYVKVLIAVPVVVLPHFYARWCPTWRTRRQVSGHLGSETKYPSLSSRFIPHHQEQSLEWSSSGLSERKYALLWLRWTKVWDQVIPLAGSLPDCARSGTGRRSFWRRACNARAWTSAVTCLPALNSASPRSAMRSLWACNVSFGFPSSGFSPRRFKTWTRNLPNGSRLNWPIPLLQRNPVKITPVANAKS